MYANNIARICYAAKLAKISGSFFALLFTLNANASCQYQITNQWNNGFTAAIKITNTSTTTINGWSINWQYANDNRLSNSWNANTSGTNPYSASNLSWNASIPPNQSVEFGFQGTKGSAAAEIPVIHGAPCGTSTPTSSVTTSSIRSSSSLTAISSSSKISSSVVA